MEIPIKLEDHGEKSRRVFTAFQKIKLHFVLCILPTLQYYSVRPNETYW